MSSLLEFEIEWNERATQWWRRKKVKNAIESADLYRKPSETFPQFVMLSLEFGEWW